MILELTIDRPAQGGRMIARDTSGAGEGRGAIVLVAGAIPGERVRARITERRHGVAFAETLEVLEPSSDRREPASDPSCGGNLLAHINYSRQLEIKQQMLADAFRRQARLELSDLPPISGSPETGYRMRARLHVSRDRVGFYRERTRDVCDAAATGQLSLPAAALVAELSAGASQLPPGIQEIVLAENVAATEQAIHPAQLLDKPDRLTEVLPSGAVLTRHAASFFQGNRFLLHTLVSKVLAAVKGESLADLFAGVGLFAAEAASRGMEVIAVESDPVSSSDLRTNLQPFAGSARAVAQPVESWLASRSSVPDAVIVDPPRAGLPPEARNRLLHLKPRTLVYVSCDPVTLARDTREFVNVGYGLRQLEALDLFPNTPHVESIAVLTL